MSEKSQICRWNAVAVHDGQSWRLLVGGGRSVATQLQTDDTGCRPYFAAATQLPSDLIADAVASGCRSIRFLVSGDVHRIEGSIPPGASLATANAEMRAAIAEATGVETDGSLVAGFTTSWPGVRKPFTLAWRFDGGAAEDFHAALAEHGIRCAGFASLELSILAAWRESRPVRDASLLVVGHGHGFLVPSQRGANPGPQAVPCGMRHFATDAANWLARFRRAATTVAKESPLHLIVLPGHGLDAKTPSIAAVLREAGFANVIEVRPEEWLRGAAAAALASKPNRLKGIAVPVANPWEPRRRFSSFWLFISAAAILALPCLFRAASEMQTKAECTALAVRQAKYRPLDEKIKKAQKSLAAAKAELAGELAAQRALVEMRRPLVSFIEVAHFFCKCSGESLVLEAIEQKGMQIEVRGTYSDPEDGVAINNGMLEFAKERNMEIVKNESAREEGGENAFANRFKVVLDCSRAGGASR